MAITKSKLREFFFPKRNTKFDKYGMKERYHLILVLASIAFGILHYLLFSSPLNVVLITTAAFGLFLYSAIKKREYAKALKNQKPTEHELEARNKLDRLINEEINKGKSEEEISEDKKKRKEELIQGIKDKWEKKRMEIKNEI
ncbi:TPA: hypothetical protein ACKTGI_003476 [Pseudomonas aeruginosa]